MEKTDEGSEMTGQNKTRSEWQPIETAPHETEVLLGWMNEWSEPNEWRCEIGCATSGRDWPAPDGGRFSSYSMHGNATHWMPLPEPPEAES